MRWWMGTAGRLLTMGALLIGATVWNALPGRSAEGGSPRDQQIADTVKQIQALQHRLQELRKTSQNSTSTRTDNLNPEWVKALKWRCIGPAAMGGRITAIAVNPKDACTYWIGTAGGGLLKTVNNGVTFDYQFTHQGSSSIGDVCVAPSNPNIVWVGTGEANPRNSVSYGDGVYKSTDGGKTWKNMGLRESFQIGRIAIDPRNPDVVYVGALGRLYGPNAERGLFRSTDGGQTWKKVLFVNDRTGVIDVQMNPKEPDTLLVAMYERQRDGFDSNMGKVADGYDRYDPIRKWGPGSGLYKTTNGGKTWTKLTKGLPTCALGRIGIDYYRKDPNTVYAIIESEKIGMGKPLPPPPQGGGYLGIVGNDADAGARITQLIERSPAARAGLKVGDIILSIDGKLVLGQKQLTERLQPHKPGDKIVVRVARDRQSKDFPIILGRRPGGRRGGRGGRGFGRRRGPSTRPYAFFLSGQRENEQKRQGPDGWQTGGIYKSTDGGETWKRINSLNPRPMYFSQLRVDPTDDRYLYVCGISLYRSSDGGKTFKPDGGREVHPDQHALWIDPQDGRHMIVGCDGGFYATYDRMQTWDYLNNVAIGQFYHVAFDLRKPYHVLGGLQDNGSWGGPSQSLSARGPVNTDWIVVGGGDGFHCAIDPNDPDTVYYESQDGNMFRRNLKTGDGAYIRPRDRKEKQFKLADKATSAILPLLGLPPFPTGLEKVEVTVPYRFNWNTPFMLSSHNPRIFYSAGNYVFRSLTRGDNPKPISPEITRTPGGSATALAESPRTPDVLWVGTDDGNLWVSRDGGEKWTEVSKNVHLPGPRWVATIEPSHFSEGRAYVAFDAHRSNDDAPYVYVTENYGKTWRSLRANLLTGSTRTLREDIENPDLLFVGTEFAAWVSLNRGESWVKLNNNLPTVAIYDFAIHPTAGELIAATHGRSLWALDIKAPRQMKPAVLSAKAYLYEPNVAIQWRSEPSHGTMYGAGNRGWMGDNPTRGATIFYSLTAPAQKIELKVVDYAGKVVRELQTNAKPGLHSVVWDFNQRTPQGRGRQARISPTKPGTYRVVLSVDGHALTQPLHVEADPVVPNFNAASDIGNPEDMDMDQDQPGSDDDDDGLDQ